MNEKIREAKELWESDPWTPELRKILDEEEDYKSAWVSAAFYGGYLAAEAEHRQEVGKLVEAYRHLLENKCFICRMHSPWNEKCTSCPDVEIFRQTLAPYHKTSCETCGGKGIVSSHSQVKGYEYFTKDRPCPTCHGAGGTWKEVMR